MGSHSMVVSPTKVKMCDWTTWSAKITRLVESTQNSFKSAFCLILMFESHSSTEFSGKMYNCSAKPSPFSGYITRLIFILFRPGLIVWPRRGCAALDCCSWSWIRWYVLLRNYFQVFFVAKCKCWTGIISAEIAIRENSCGLLRRWRLKWHHAELGCHFLPLGSVNLVHEKQVGVVTNRPNGMFSVMQSHIKTERPEYDGHGYHEANQKQVLQDNDDTLDLLNGRMSNVQREYVHH